FAAGAATNPRIHSLKPFSHSFQKCQPIIGYYVFYVKERCLFLGCLAHSLYWLDWFNSFNWFGFDQTIQLIF
ncbi:MAG: hypothetical protein PVF09_16835, partial [Desulfobacterales bacterium]